MTFNWQEVITSLGSSGLLLAGGVYLFKTSMSQWMARDVERFKSQLKSDADAEIERLKHSLVMTASDHQVRFAKLHERRAEVIADVYQRLVDVYEQTKTFMNSAPLSDAS